MWCLLVEPVSILARMCEKGGRRCWTATSKFLVVWNTLPVPSFKARFLFLLASCPVVYNTTTLIFLIFQLTHHYLVGFARWPHVDEAPPLRLVLVQQGPSFQIRSPQELPPGCLFKPKCGSLEVGNTFILQAQQYLCRCSGDLTPG